MAVGNEVKRGRDVIRITVKATTSESFEGKDGQSARREFWGAILRKEDPYWDHQLYRIESRLRVELPMRMLHAISAQFEREIQIVRKTQDELGSTSELFSDISRKLEANVHRAHSKANRASSMRFEVSTLDYGSLVMDILVYGAERLLEELPGGLDEFLSIVEAAMPESFNASVPPLEAMPTFSVTCSENSTSGAEAGANAPSNPGQGLESRRERLSRLVWSIANGWFVLPLGAAMVVFYFAVQELSKARQDNRDALKTTMEHYRILLEEDRKRIQRLSDKVDELRSKPVVSTNSVAKKK